MLSFSLHQRSIVCAAAKNRKQQHDHRLVGMRLERRSMVRAVAAPRLAPRWQNASSIMNTRTIFAVHLNQA